MTQRCTNVSIDVGGQATVSGVLHHPGTSQSNKGTIVIAHGAGADMHHPFMVSAAGALCALDYVVLRFNFLYTEGKRKRPDAPALLERTCRAAIAFAAQINPGLLIVGGKSMGGRIASHLVAQGLPCDGLLLLGYPLHPAGQPEKRRDRHLYDIKLPMLFVQGTRDPLCDLNLLRPVLARLGTNAVLSVVDGGDHSLVQLKSMGQSPTKTLDDVAHRVDQWVSDTVLPRR